MIQAVAAIAIASTLSLGAAMTAVMPVAKAADHSRPAYCAKTQLQPLARLICLTPELWPIDNQLNRTYQAFYGRAADKQKVTGAQKSLVAQSRCLTGRVDAVQCIYSEYSVMIAAMDKRMTEWDAELRQQQTKLMEETAAKEWAACLKNAVLSLALSQKALRQSLTQRWPLAYKRS